MHKITYLLFITLVLVSCGSNSENKPEESEEIKFSDSQNPEKKIHIPDDPKSRKETASNESDPENPNYRYHTIMPQEFRDSIRAHFSDLKLKDLFTFYMPEGNIDSTESVLRIYSPQGELIYEKKFVTAYMINGYDLEFIKNEAEMEKYILKKAREKLSSVHFTNLDKVDKYSLFEQMQAEDYENYDVYLECKKTKRPVFSIGLGEEDGTFIGFSKKQQKVLDVIYCC